MIVLTRSKQLTGSTENKGKNSENKMIKIMEYFVKLELSPIFLSVGSPTV